MLYLRAADRAMLQMVTLSRVPLLNITWDPQEPSNCSCCSAGGWWVQAATSKHTKGRVLKHHGHSHSADVGERCSGPVDTDRRGMSWIYRQCVQWGVQKVMHRSTQQGGSKSLVLQKLARALWGLDKLSCLRSLEGLPPLSPLEGLCDVSKTAAKPSHGPCIW